MHPPALCPDVQLYLYAKTRKQHVYKMDPLVVLHHAGYSNTWHKDRGDIVKGGGVLFTRASPHAPHTMPGDPHSAVPVINAAGIQGSTLHAAVPVLGTVGVAAVPPHGKLLHAGVAVIRTAGMVVVPSQDDLSAARTPY